MIQSAALSFFVPGLARSKGSKRAITHKHTGKPVLIDSAGAGLKAWERDVRFAAAKAMNGRGLMWGPVILILNFVLPRPKSAPKRRRTWPVTKPDLSKLTRAVEDALTNICYQDDSQIVTEILTKDYGDPPGVEITMTQLRADSG